VKGLLPVVGAGASFAGCTLAGLAAGWAIGSRTGHPLWVVGGMAAGLALGGYSAYRLLMQSLSA
jgi:hypothetical protein